MIFSTGIFLKRDVSRTQMQLQSFRVPIITAMFNSDLAAVSEGTVLCAATVKHLVHS